AEPGARRTRTSRDAPSWSARLARGAMALVGGALAGVLQLRACGARFGARGRERARAPLDPGRARPARQLRPGRAGAARHARRAAGHAPLVPGPDGFGIAGVRSPGAVPADRGR